MIAKPGICVSASRDGNIILWVIKEEEQKLMFSFANEQNIQEPLTKAVWTPEGHVLASTTFGRIYKCEVAEDAQKVPFLKPP